MMLRLSQFLQRLFWRSRSPRTVRYPARSGKWRPGLSSPPRLHPSSTAGLSLIELLTSTVITTIVILIVGNGLMSALNATKSAEARTARRTELNRAFDFVTNEIRMAESINRTNSLSASATTSLATVVQNAGLGSAQLGNFGAIALYLEIPIEVQAPGICPAGGPNAGQAPPTPTDYDQVVYDIRPSIQGWLGPRSVTRYGRIPQSNGVINPCSSPVSSDTLIDAISTTMPTVPNCPAPAVLTGAEGFRACVDGAQVDLLFQSNVVGSQVRRLSSSALSRPMTARPALQLSLVRPSTKVNAPDTVDLAWSWTGYSSGTNFKVYRAIEGDANSQQKIYDGNNLGSVAILTGSQGTNNCFVVEARNGTALSKSDTECVIK